MEPEAAAVFLGLVTPQLPALGKECATTSKQNNMKHSKQIRERLRRASGIGPEKEMNSKRRDASQGAAVGHEGCRCIHAGRCGDP